MNIDLTEYYNDYTSSRPFVEYCVEVCEAIRNIRGSSSIGDHKRKMKLRFRYEWHGQALAYLVADCSIRLVRTLPVDTYEIDTVGMREMPKQTQWTINNNAGPKRVEPDNEQQFREARV